VTGTPPPSAVQMTFRIEATTDANGGSYILDTLSLKASVCP
jgi:hypothetical protein